MRSASLTDWRRFSGAPPDEELMSAAADGTLLEESVLLEQTERMLSHPRAKNFYEGFISQWMHLKRLDSVGLSALRFFLHHRCLSSFREAGAGRVFQNSGGGKSIISEPN